MGAHWVRVNSEHEQCCHVLTYQHILVHKRLHRSIARVFQSHIYSVFPKQHDFCSMAYQTFIVQSQFDEVRSRKICPHASVFTSPLPVFVFLPPYLTGLVLISLFSLVNLSLRRSLSVSQFVCYRPHVSPVLLSVTEPLPNQLRHIIYQECRTPGKKTSKERLHTSLKTA